MLSSMLILKVLSMFSENNLASSANQWKSNKLEKQEEISMYNNCRTFIQDVKYPKRVILVDLNLARNVVFKLNIVPSENLRS